MGSRNLTGGRGQAPGGIKRAAIEFSGCRLLTLDPGSADGAVPVVTPMLYRYERMFAARPREDSCPQPERSGRFAARAQCRGGRPMKKVRHEFRDPVHGFIHVNPDERDVIDSAPVQRLRHIHQLSLSYLVYPGATHRRFEHSLGVMELAGKVFDVITDRHNVTDDVRELLPEVDRDDTRDYWRTTVRLAALLHDIGHLPFSHGVEHELLPEGYKHERLTRELLLSDHLAPLLSGGLSQPLRPEVIAKLAVGRKESPGEVFSPWERILSEIVVDDAFGVDRMDYLQRDSIHAGVFYGRFDHPRLVATLRILAEMQTGDDEPEPAIGVEIGGLESAEALLIARYMMFSQVYFHKARLMYDAHLQDFLADWLEGGKFSTDLTDHLALTDVEVIAAIRAAAYDAQAPGYRHARRINDRQHFKVLYRLDPGDLELSGDPGAAAFAAAVAEFGPENVKRANPKKAGGDVGFPVSIDGQVRQSTALSPTLRSLAPASVDMVFVDPTLHQKARLWWKKNREDLLKAYNAEGEI